MPPFYVRKQLISEGLVKLYVRIGPRANRLVLPAPAAIEQAKEVLLTVWSRKR